jgi:hypothetical protein
MNWQSPDVDLSSPELNASLKRIYSNSSNNYTMRLDAAVILTKVAPVCAEECGAAATSRKWDRDKSSFSRVPSARYFQSESENDSDSGPVDSG